jgi:hypothetical protein
MKLFLEFNMLFKNLLGMNCHNNDETETKWDEQLAHAHA